MKKLLILIFFLYPMLTLSQQPGDNKVLLLNESKLTIHGSSNITDFSCVSEHELEEDTVSFNVENLKESITITRSSLVLEIEEFDCGKRGINRDFRQTLKFKEHPNINIELKGLQTISGDEYPSSAVVDIIIAGIKKEYTVPLQNLGFHANTIYASGKKVLVMSDFKLEPPSPMLGLVKVDDELEIRFDLVIRQIAN